MKSRTISHPSFDEVQQKLMVCPLRSERDYWTKSPFKSWQRRVYVRLECGLGPILSVLVPKRPKIFPVVLSSSKLKSRLRIAHCSDLHAASWIQKDYVDAIHAMIEEMQPDLICWTGDFIHTHLAPLEKILPRLTPLHRSIPTFGVLGNHDYFVDKAKLVAFLESCGIHMLQNDCVIPAVGEGRLCVHGIDDYYFGGGYLDAEKLDPCRLNVLLTHQPDFVWDLPPRSIDLALAGHLHGGQLNWPVTGPLYLPAAHGRLFVDHPVCSVHGNPLHTTPGLGYTFIPFRLRCPPVISCIDLVPSGP